MRVLNNKVKILGLTLLFSALSSEALTLGRVRGAAWIGQPLEVTIPVQLAAGEDADALCFEAEVFHSDVRQEARRVRVTVEASAPSQSAQVRVRSSAPVDEPVVTLYLRTGCGQKTTRRYVLLADMPSDIAPPLAAASPTFARAVPGPVLAPVRTELMPLESEPDVKVRKERVAKAPTSKPKLAVATSPREPAGEKMKPARPSGQSRLKLDPLEFLSDRVANLDTFMVFEPPADALRNQDRIQTLEQAVNTSQRLAAKSEASLADLKARLQQAESGRFPVGVLYGLVALVLASLAAVAFLWHRLRQQVASRADWWNDKVEMQADGATEPTPAAPDPAPQVPGQPLSNEAAPVKVSLSESASEMGSLSAKAVDVDLLDLSDSAFGHFSIDKADEGQPPSASLVAVAPQPRGVVCFSSEAVQDLRQQAEFFVSLGESERAIRLLKRQIDESQAPNPLYYLDLLDILQTHHLKNEFQHWREKFQQIFTGRVPEFALFKREGRDLASYPELLSRLTALWRTPAVLEEIEASLFVAPGINPEPMYDLAAFRDLLLLHAVAKSSFDAAPEAEGTAPVLGSFAHVSLDTPEFESAPKPPSPGVTPAPQVLDLDLDLNLDVVDQSPNGEEPLADVGLDFELPGLRNYAVQDEVKPLAGDENMIDFQITKPPPSA